MNGKAELGPDQMGDVSNSGSIRRGRPFRQVEIAAQDRLLGLRGEGRVVLADVRLDQAQFHAGERGAGRRHQPDLAKDGHDDQRKNRDKSRRQVEPAFAHPPQRRWRGEDRDRQEGEAVQADERGGLGERKVDAERHAEIVPGKAGEEKAARPFSDPKPEGESENARGSRRPQETRKRKSGGRKDGQRRRQRHERQWQRPGEFVGLDQKGRADPPERAEKIAEAHPPAGAECGAQRPLGPAILRPVDQPDGDGQRNGDQGKQRPGRQRQRPERSRNEGDGASAPAPGENDSLDQRGRTVGLRQDHGIGNAQRIASPYRSNRHGRP